MDKSKKFGLSPEIAKLVEKLAKDPPSKLFVPLAEEYRKIGMLDEAIQILMDGLNANPNYMTARVSLGKMLLEKGNISEAQQEFEKVIEAIPDNLFAHKKLAEIYQSEGDRENLLKEYKIIISLSPKDEEVRNALEELERTVAQKPETTLGEEIYQGREIRPDFPLKEESEVLEAATVEEEAPSVSAITPEDIHQRDWESDITSKEEITVAEIEVTEDKGKEVVYELPEEEISPEDLGIDIPLKMSPVIEGISPKEMEMSEAFIKEHPKPAPDRETREEDIMTETLADIYIKQGLYEKADEIYQQILTSEPENTAILQKRSELILLLNLIRGKESKTQGELNKLEAWLKNINERRR